MTDAQAAQIEHEFSLKIPSSWRHFITERSSCERFAASGLLIDYEDLRSENRLYRDSEYVRDYWRPSWLAIHADGCGNAYFLDTLHPTAVFELDHEKTFPGYNPCECEVFPSIDAFISHIIEYEL